KKRLWKRCTAILVLAAFFAAELLPFVPQPAAAQPCAMMMAGPSSTDGTDHASKDDVAMPDCGLGWSCMVMVALPELFKPFSTSFVWGRVYYWTASNALDGISVPPDYSPPIDHA